MSDQSPPPPKPKPGSLRDRIAAFEKSASSAAPPAPANAPAPRPKPAGFASWKPKAPSPPASPSAGSTDHTASPPRAGGMSASDAKESITKAGSLKDRMAALQGKGAFGAPPSIAPKPTVERPKWKPPPVVHTPADDGDHTGASSTAAIASAVERTISPPIAVKPDEHIDTVKVSYEGGEPAAPTVNAEGDTEGPPPEADPEEEERQRRAAIAARMARLGGARVGMAPPVFGKKPPVRRSTHEDVPKSEESPKSAEHASESIRATAASPPAEPGIVASPPEESTSGDKAELSSGQSPEYFPARKTSENASILSVDSTGSQPARSPSSMPIPTVPRRAGPPRKKPVKAVPPPPPEVTEERSEEVVAPVSSEEVKKEVSAEAELPEKQEEVKELTENDLEPKPLNDTQQDVPHETNPERDSNVEQHEASSVLVEAVSPSPSLAKETSDISPPPSHAANVEEVKGAEVEVDEVEEVDVLAASTSPFVHASQSPPQQFANDKRSQEDLENFDAAADAATNVLAEEDEAEEEARKKRVAEKLAKMGGINPFAPPPQNKSPTQLPQSPPIPAVQSKSLSEPPSVSSEGPHDAEEEENVVEATVEEEGSDEEDEVEDNDPADEPSGDANEPERPITPTLPHSEFRRQSTNSELQPSPPPPPPTRPPVHIRQDEEEEEDASEYEYEDAESEQGQSAPAPPPRPLSFSARSPTVIPSDRDNLRESEASSAAGPPQAPRRIIPLAPEPTHAEEEVVTEEEDIDEEVDERLSTSQLFVPPPSRGPIPIPCHVQAEAEEDGDGSENDSPALPVPHRRSMEVPPGRPIPPPPPPVPSSFEEDEELDSDHDGQALPIPPRRSMGSPPEFVPPPPPPRAFPSPSYPVPHDTQAIVPQPEAGYSSASPEHLTPTVSISGSEEILDAEEGDPIDPSFHSPSRRASFASIDAVAQAHSQEGFSETHALAKTSPPLTEDRHAVQPPTEPEASSGDSAEQPEEDAEQLRRRTIAERMAKLGGIRFGAAPLPTPTTRPPPARPQVEKEDADSVSPADEQSAEALSEEEEERARKERIAAKMASMGGMRIGMMPINVGGLPPPKSHVLREEASSPPLPSAAPARAVPPARPPPPPAPVHAPPHIDTDSEYGSAVASDDGVKVEAEESEMEEVGYSDAQEDHEEEAPPPPPVPSRLGRAPSRQVSVDKPSTPVAPPIPSPRPPVPTAMVGRRSSVQTSRSSTSNSGLEAPIQRKSSAFMPPAQSEYVMVEEPEQLEMPPPPPPARPSSHLPPARPTSQLPPAKPSRTSDTHEWELPSIPTSDFDFGEGADLSLSWTDAGELTSPTTSAPPQPPAKRQSVPPAAERQLSADHLMALWGRVGVQVCEAATALFEKSKKSLIGDGTYVGFVRSVLAAVPNAASEASGYGYLIYSQNGGSVQKRVSEIMPGDIVEIIDAKFKGHKGLQTYHQIVGGVGGEALVGVVGEVEAKKSKIRVFQANQHVGQQTVESVSYRLEDLKSGVVKVYRVLDA